MSEETTETVEETPQDPEEIARRQQEFAEQVRKYKAWLEENGWTEKDKRDFTTCVEDLPDTDHVTIILYKKVSEHTVPRSKPIEKEDTDPELVTE